MDVMVIAHVAAGIALVCCAALVGAWGLARRHSIASCETGATVREARWFGHALQLSHTLVAAAGLFGVLLLADGRRPNDPLHTRVYGVFMVVAIVAAYGYRTRDAASNIRVFSIASLVIGALGLRAITTGS